MFKLLDPKDMVVGVKTDDKSVTLYVAKLHQALTVFTERAVPLAKGTLPLLPNANGDGDRGARHLGLDAVFCYCCKCCCRKEQAAPLAEVSEYAPPDPRRRFAGGERSAIVQFDPAPQCAWVSVTCPTSVVCTFRN